MSIEPLSHEQLLLIDLLACVVLYSILILQKEWAVFKNLLVIFKIQ